MKKYKKKYFGVKNGAFHGREDSTIVFLLVRFVPVNWPPRSCYLTSLDYSPCEYVKYLVNADKPASIESLEANFERVSCEIQIEIYEIEAHS